MRPIIKDYLHFRLKGVPEVYAIEEAARLEVQRNPPEDRGCFWDHVYGLIDHLPRLLREAGVER